MASSSFSHNRRQFLRGLGASVTLPMFAPLQGFGAEHGARKLATTASGMPLRATWLYVPNGVNVEKWRSGETLKEVAQHREAFSILSGLEVEKGSAGGDGGGDHARGSAAFLTGVRPRKTAGSDICAGQSIDQLAAEHLGDVTRFRSLELSADRGRRSGACDSGYACAYQYNLSWRSSDLPMAPENNPRLLFERLFGAGSQGERRESLGRRSAQAQSVLDFVNEDAKSLQKQLDGTDRAKLEEYLTSVREIERRIQKAEQWAVPDVSHVETPSGIPESYEEHVRLLFDLMLLAFETDSTRVATFSLAHEGSNRSFSEIGVHDGHHRISHHKNSPDHLAKIALIDRFYAQQFDYFLTQAKAKKDADGSSLLDNSMVIYGSSMSDGNTHSNKDIPLILAGGGGGAFTAGQDLKLEDDTPVTNLYLRMMKEMGISKPRFGDSTGVLQGV